MDEYGIILPSRHLKYLIVRRKDLLLPFSIPIAELLHTLIDYTLEHP